MIELVCQKFFHKLPKSAKEIERRREPEKRNWGLIFSWGFRFASWARVNERVGGEFQ